MDILKQLYWFLLTLGVLIAPAVIIYNIFSIFSFFRKYWPKPEQEEDERKGNTLLAKRIAFCAVPFIIFFGFVSAIRLIILLVNPPDAAGLFGGGVDFRVHYLAFVGLATFLVALTGLPFALFRYEALERQTLAQEEGLITDRINKAVESLGAAKTVSRMGRTVDFNGIEGGIHQQRTIIQWRDQNTDKQFKSVSAPKYGDWTVFNETLPNLEVRIGAIYALERIAQDSLRDHIQIMEILCAYIRQNAPANEAPELPQPPAWFEGEDPQSDDSWREQFDAWKHEHSEALQNVKPRGDIQTALTVIGRRSDKQKAKEWGDDERYAAFQNGPPEFPEFEIDESGTPAQAWRDAVKSWHKEFDQWRGRIPAYRLDLRETNLRKADMSSLSQRADFSHARFERAEVQGTDFEFARMRAVDFSFVQAQGARFWNAQVQGADFLATQAQWAVFRRAQVQGADFRHAQVQGADFLATQCDEKTNFSATQFLSAGLKGDFSMLELTQEQVNAAFGDGFTAAHLPEGLTKPDHWPDWDLGFIVFDDEWHKWQREGTAYVPPPKPAE